MPSCKLDPDDRAKMPAEALLQVRNLQIEFSGPRGVNPAVQGASFEVRRGETLAIVGESGSGKSVTALSILRLGEAAGARIRGGSILFRMRNGEVRDLTSAPMAVMDTLRGKDIGMVFQEPMSALNPVMPVGAQIVEVLRRHSGLSARAARVEAVELLDRVRLAEPARCVSSYPHQLSGGMRQRVMIAMALACRPSLLIADEPTSALDVTTQADILRLMQTLQDDMGMAMLVITHDMGVVAEIADRVVVMQAGRTLETGTAQEIFARPRHPYTRALLAAVPQAGVRRGEDRNPATVPKAPVPPALLEVDRLVKRFAVRRGPFGRVTGVVHALEQVSFSIFPGETLALVGESGCGKSTCGRALVQLVTPGSGSVRFEGRDMAGLPAREQRAIKARIQYIFQDPHAALNPRRSVGLAIAEPLQTHDLAHGAAVAERVAELMEIVGLDPARASRYPHEFSGGETQRIAIARALASNPRLIIADEAVAALDMVTRARIIALLQDVQRRFGLACLFISHDLAMVEAISHRVAVMHCGQIVEIAPCSALFDTPQHPQTRALLAAVPARAPAGRRRGRAPLGAAMPGALRRVGDPPQIAPLVEVAPGHLVARHAEGLG